MWETVLIFLHEEAYSATMRDVRPVIRVSVLPESQHTQDQPHPHQCYGDERQRTYDNTKGIPTQYNIIMTSAVYTNTS